MIIRWGGISAGFSGLLTCKLICLSVTLSHAEPTLGATYLGFWSLLPLFPPHLCLLKTQQVSQEVFIPALQLTRPVGLLSVTGVGTGQDRERQRPLGGLGYSWSSQILGAYKQLSLSAGCLLNVWAADLANHFLSNTLLLTLKTEEELVLVVHTDFIKYFHCIFKCRMWNRCQYLSNEIPVNIYVFWEIKRLGPTSPLSLKEILDKTS